MKVPIVILKRYTKRSDTDPSYDFGSPTSITSFRSISFDYGYADKKDVFSLNLLPNYIYIASVDDYRPELPDIQSDDAIEIYCYYEDDVAFEADGVTVSDFDSYLMFTGIVDKFNFESNGAEMQMNISGVNRTEILLNNQEFMQYTDEIIPNMLVDTAVKIRNKNKNKPLFMFKDYKGDGTDTLGSEPLAYDFSNNEYYGSTIEGYESWGNVPRGGIRAYKNDAYEYDETEEYWKLKTGIDLDEVDGDGILVYRFAEKNYYQSYKSMYSHLETISTPIYTDDSAVGTYITYITFDYNLHWEPKNPTYILGKTTSQSTLAEQDMSQVSIGKQIRDVTNAIIINAGQDAKNNGIISLSYNSASMAKYGAKWKYIADTQIAEQIRKDLQIYVGVDNYNDNNNFPDSGEYPVYAHLTEQSRFKEDDGVTPIWSFTRGVTELSNDGEYNDYLRKVIREHAVRKGNEIAGRESTPKYFGSFVSSTGTNMYSIGELVKLEIPSYDWSSSSATKNLRVQAVKQRFANGWTTTFTLEEDSNL